MSAIEILYRQYRQREEEARQLRREVIRSVAKSMPAQATPYAISEELRKRLGVYWPQRDVEQALA